MERGGNMNKNSDYKAYCVLAVIYAMTNFFFSVLYIMGRHTGLLFIFTFVVLGFGLGTRQSGKEVFNSDAKGCFTLIRISEIIMLIGIIYYIWKFNIIMGIIDIVLSLFLFLLAQLSKDKFLIGSSEFIMLSCGVIWADMIFVASSATLEIVGTFSGVMLGSTVWAGIRMVDSAGGKS